MPPAAPTPTPFRLHVDDAVLADLRERLARTRWPDQTPGEPWAHGSDLAYVQGLCDHWRTGFDWRAQEAALNAFHQYTPHRLRVRCSLTDGNGAFIYTIFWRCI